MLVLTRKAQEQIRIGEDILVTVVRIKGGNVRIGIEAPDDVRILREEVHAQDEFTRRFPNQSEERTPPRKKHVSERHGKAENREFANIEFVYSDDALPLGSFLNQRVQAEEDELVEC